MHSKSSLTQENMKHLKIIFNCIINYYIQWRRDLKSERAFLRI